MATIGIIRPLDVEDELAEWFNLYQHTGMKNLSLQIKLLDMLIEREKKIIELHDLRERSTHIEGKVLATSVHDE